MMFIFSECQVSYLFSSNIAFYQKSAEGNSLDLFLPLFFFFSFNNSWGIQPLSVCPNPSVFIQNQNISGVKLEWAKPEQPQLTLSWHFPSCDRNLKVLLRHFSWIFWTSSMRKLIWLSAHTMLAFQRLQVQVLTWRAKSVWRDEILSLLVLTMLRTQGQQNQSRAPVQHPQGQRSTAQGESSSPDLWIKRYFALLMVLFFVIIFSNI